MDGLRGATSVRAMIKVSDDSAARAGNVAGQLRSALQRLASALWSRVAAEHRCYPPDDGRDWIKVPTSPESAGRYICPECEQHFLPREQASDEQAEHRE
jgi:hypothetical protein